MRVLSRLLQVGLSLQVLLSDVLSIRIKLDLRARRDEQRWIGIYSH